MGYSTDLANDGSEALEKMDATTYDIVFLDLNMPKFDGLTVAKIACEKFPPDVRPTLVAMTANGKFCFWSDDCMQRERMLRV
jgi:CheY-like chemotaxis protein